MLPIIKQLHEQGKLTKAQQLILADTKPREELYDLESDPHELNNLSQSPAHQKTLAELQVLLDNWIAETNDTGLATVTARGSR